MDDRVAASGTPRGHFLAGTDHWREQLEFLDFALHSPLPAIVAALLGSEHVWLYEDSVLVKEPGTAEKTVFHQDMAYFHLEGDQVCTTWVPLDPVDVDLLAAGGARGWLAARHVPGVPAGAAQHLRRRVAGPVVGVAGRHLDAGVGLPGEKRRDSPGTAR